MIEKPTKRPGLRDIKGQFRPGSRRHQRISEIRQSAIIAAAASYRHVKPRRVWASRRPSHASDQGRLPPKVQITSVTWWQIGPA